MTSKDIIKKILEEYPYNYSQQIKKNIGLMRDLGPLLDQCDLKTAIYCYVNDIDPICQYGNLQRLSCGKLRFCGYANVCKCNRDVSLTKRKDTCLKKYGVESFTQTDTFNKKREETSYKKYGTRLPPMSSTSKEKNKQTKLERYGDENYNNLEKNKQTKLERYGDENYTNIEKKKQTNLKKYGVENTFSSKEIREKIIKTNLEKYGASSTLSNDEIRLKAKQTKLEKYGNEHYTNREKAKETNLKKYGVENVTQRVYDSATYEILNDKDKFIEFVTGKNRSISAYDLNVDTTTISNYVLKYNCQDVLSVYTQSKWEIIIAEYLDELNIKYEQNTKGIISPHELDFYLPDYNVAIEINGNYWHSEIAGNKDKDYHYNKWVKCREQGIDLYSYFEDELINNIDIIKNKIRYLINKNNGVVGARKCKIKAVTVKEETEFLNKYHIQGATKARNKTIGAFYNNELVAVFSWQLKKHYLEITRFACDSKASYPGLFSKMMKYMIKELDYTGDVVSFSNNGHSNGGVYKANGFIVDSILKGSYWYTKNYIIRENRQGYMKNKIARKFNIDMSNKTEWQAMQELGYDRIWDSGKIKWVKTI